MSIKRALAIALSAAAAVPAAAAAQTPVNPPEADNYLNPVFMSTPQSPLTVGSPVGFVADTTNYTVQQDMFNPRSDGSPGSGGPPEPAVCGSAPYGNTVWSVFYAHRYGIMNVTSSGPFDSVIGILPFGNPSTDTTPRISQGFCVDDIAGFDQQATFLVSPKHWYAVQVGGTGVPQGGKVQVKFQLNRPPSVDGAAFLFWKTNPLRVSNMYVKSVPKGEKLTLSCTKHACRKKSINVKSKPLARSLPAADGPRMKGAPAKGNALGADPALRQLVHEAKKQVAVLKNHRVKKGAKIELRITRTGFIGKYYVWSVGASSISAAKTRCMNPGSSTPRKTCHG